MATRSSDSPLRYGRRTVTFTHLLFMTRSQPQRCVLPHISFNNLHGAVQTLKDRLQLPTPCAQHAQRDRETDLGSPGCSIRGILLYLQGIAGIRVTQERQAAPTDWS